MVEADEVRLTQVVSNLLTNAARYTPSGGHVEVTGASEDDEVVLRVRDSGTGIDPALLPKLFEMFVQGPQGRDRTAGGLGLGLALVRSLTTLHGGTVSAHSDGPGRGSEFVVRLPASMQGSSVESVRPVDQPARDARANGRRILVVDDNRDAAQMVASLLAGAGHEVQMANDPCEALSLAETFHPQIAILDIGLPVMDGYMLGRELRDRLSPEPPKLVALTGYGQGGDKRRSMEERFAFHLVKPIDCKVLLRVCEALAG
jgi:CheY-like chemotaxis protein/anti-sigma regulatory factor (Ser/Thr protein kinase)